MLILFQNLTHKDKSSAIDKLIKGSTPSQDYFLMVILSIVTATLGLLLNNASVIIGSMLIAPILYPVLSLSLGLIMSDSELIGRAFYTIAKSVALAIGIAALSNFLFGSHFTELTPEILSRTYATLPYIAIAIAAGFAASFALVKPQLSETLPGIAISVALIPPLAVTGIGIANFNPQLASGSLLLFLANIVGIIFASMITFSLMNFYMQRKEAHTAALKEDAKVKHEFEKAALKKI